MKFVTSGTLSSSSFILTGLALLKAILLAVTLSAVIVTTNLGSVARAGVREGGGGNTRESTPAEIRAALLRVKTIELSYSFARVGRHLNSIQDAATQEAFAKIFSNYGEGGISDDILNSTYAFQNKPCRDQLGDRKDASALIYDRRGLICFSFSRFKKIEPQSLSSTMLALAAHEHSHHLGATEKEAQLIQAFFAEHPSIVKHNPVSGILGGQANTLTYELSIVNRMIDAEPSEASLCSALGRIQGVAGAMAAVVAIDHGEVTPSIFDAAPVTEEVRHLMQRSYVDAYGIGGFCEPLEKNERLNLLDYRPGDQHFTVDEVRLGDRDALKKRVLKFLEYTRPLETEIDVY